jgi:hypothetical protein
MKAKKNATQTCKQSNENENGPSKKTININN